MAERKAVNKWYPSDFDPKKHGSANGYQNTHHLRERARKIDQGILIVRFELPFNIWCLGCNNHIGMGVRYNAEKKKVGSYYSTKIFEFRMKCHLCTNYFTIKTDPQNLDYVVVSGARRQNKRWNEADNEQTVITDDKDKQDKLASNSMFKLEHLAEDKNKLLRLVPTLERLEDLQEDRWKDDYKSNQDLRRIFRKTRNELKLKAIEDQKLLDKCGNKLVLVDESPTDIRLSKLMQLDAGETATELKRKKRDDILHDTVGLQRSSLDNHFKHTNFKTPELKTIAKSLVRKNTEQLNRENLVTKLKLNIKKVKPDDTTETKIKSLVANYSDSSDDDQ